MFCTYLLGRVILSVFLICLARDAMASTNVRNLKGDTSLSEDSLQNSRKDTSEYYIGLMKNKARSNMVFCKATYEYCLNCEAVSEEDKIRQKLNIKYTKATANSAERIFNKIGEDGFGQAFLINYMRTRFKYIEYRKEGLSRGYLTSTSPSSMKTLFRERDRNDVAAQNYSATRGNIELWQNMSELIFLGVKNIITRGESLEPELESMLRASTTLIPVFEGITDQFGHPDQGIQGIHEDPKYLHGKKRELFYYDLYIKRYSYLVDCHGRHQWDRTVKEVSKTAFEFASLYGYSKEEIKEIKSDGEFLENVMNDEPAEKRKFTKKCTKWRKKCFYYPLTDYSFLYPEKKKEVEIKIELEDEKKYLIATDGKNRVPVDYFDTVTMGPSLMDSLNKRLGNGLENPVLKPVIKMKKCLEEDIHSKQKTKYDLLSNKHKKTIDRIFELETNKVTTKKWFNLHYAIYGKNTNNRKNTIKESSGSHVTLLNSNDCVLGYSHRLHGGRKHYLKDELEYMKDILLENGISPL